VAKVAVVQVDPPLPALLPLLPHHKNFPNTSTALFSKRGLLSGQMGADS
jgi:hypothetical protein